MKRPPDPLADIAVAQLGSAIQAGSVQVDIDPPAPVQLDEPGRREHPHLDANVLAAGDPGDLRLAQQAHG